MTATPTGPTPDDSAGLPPIAVEDTITPPPSDGQTLKFDTTFSALK